MSESTLSEQLADYFAALRFEQIPLGVIGTTKLHVLDSLGCLFAGSRLEPGKLAFNLAASASNGNSQAALLGTNLRVSNLDAVQAMATAAHCGELDDIHAGAATCIGAMVIPALIVMAEKYRGSGASFLAAVVAGYETTLRIGLAINAPNLFQRGWWPSTVCGPFGVAAAGAKFLDWPADKTANALGIAALQAGGMLTGGQEGATARHIAFGRAAQNGLVSLLATEEGMSGPRRALEDPRGFCLTLCAEPRWEYLQCFDKFYLPEVAFKPYPCARQLHAGVEALLQLIHSHSIRADKIRVIELAVPTQNASMVDRPTLPTSRAATLGSAQYVMAVTVLRGKIDLASFDEDLLGSADVSRMMAKVKVRGSVELDSHYPKYWSGRVTVLLSDGGTHSQEIIVPKGERENPLSAGDVEEKFIALAAPIVGDGNAQGIVTEMQSLDSCESIEPLLELLKVSV